MSAPSEMPLDQTRVIGIFAHVDAGKTTTSEAFLYYTGRIHRIGRVDEGSTQLDWMAQERARGITVTSAATTCYWHDHRVNLIDTPGHIDFSAEVVRSIRVIDGAVIVLCGVGGVEPQTETVWMHAEREELPRLIFVNKLDRQGADFDRVLAEIREQLTPNAVALQMPIGREDELKGVVDLITQQAFVWSSDEPTDAVSRVPVPADMAETVATTRASLLDAICETDDVLLEQRLDGRDPEASALQAALRAATVAGDLVPVLCGSALKRLGIQPLLDAVSAYLPSPLDAPTVRGGEPKKADDPDAPLCAAAFKIVTDPYVGHLTWVRVFAGQLSVRSKVLNPRADVQERVTRIYRMHANKREQVERIATGDVAALVGVKSAATGDTLCHPDHPIALETFAFPEPVIMVALTPQSDEEQDRLLHAVTQLCSEDPTLIARYDPDTREETLSGMGELHLEIAIDRLKTEFGLSPEVGLPQIAYRETARKATDFSATYQKQTGGHGHYAQVFLRVEPLERGAGVEFDYSPLPKAEESGRHHGRHRWIPNDFVRPAELGVREELERGSIAGCPITDVRVTLLGGRFHEVDSSGQDFKLAAAMAVRRAMRRARPALLEPIMRIDVTARDQHVGAITSDLGRRRGRIKDMKMRGSLHVLSGHVPLSEARGYATDLRSLTQGRATFTMELQRYDAVPDAIAEGIIEQRRKEGKIPER